MKKFCSALCYKKLVIALLVVFIINCFNSTCSASGETKIHFINTGGSSAFLIESMGGYGLIDTSNPSHGYEPEPTEVITPESVNLNEKDTAQHVVKYLKSIMPQNKTLDFLVVTHAHYDHSGGVKQIVEAGFVDSSTKYYYKPYETTGEENDNPEWANPLYYAQAIAAVEGKGAEKKPLTDLVGDDAKFEFGKLTINFYNTESRTKLAELGYVPEGSMAYSENENSIVTLITHDNGKKVLLAADIHIAQELRLIEEGSASGTAIAEVDILKVGHHGYTSSSCYNFLEHTNPDKIIVDNSFLGNENIVRYFTENSKEPQIYLTGNSSDAIVMRFNDTSYDMIDGIIEGESEKVETDFMLKEEQKNFAENEWYLGWHQFNEKWYYFCKTDNEIEGYRRGEMVTGWQNLSVSDGTEYNFYFNSDGQMQIGWQQIEGEWYYFYQDGEVHEGAMATGWQNLLAADGNEYRFYFNDDGTMAMGWKNIDDKWYYFYEEYSEIEGTMDGAMVTGWHDLTVTDGNYRFYFNVDGIMLTGWQEIEGSWYYFYQADDEIEGAHEGGMITGRHELTRAGEKNYYYFCENDGSPEGYELGEMIANTTYNGYTYDSSGKEVVVETETFTVTFELNGGSMTGENTITVNSGERVIRPTQDPVKNDYNFVGWYTTSELISEFDFINTEINADTVIYAKWIVKSEVDTSIIIPIKVDAIQIWTEYFNGEKYLSEFIVRKQELTWE